MTQVFRGRLAEEARLRTIVRVLVVAVLAVAFTTPVRAAPEPPAANNRVVLADPDPELKRAIASVLSPWKLEIVVEDTPPANTSEANMRATAATARFVVWRRNGDLVVFDRERGAAEHREGPPGSLDAVSAAAAALTIKTLMRLPPVPVEKPPGGVVIVPTPSAGGPELRAQAGLATRLARGSQTDLGARLVAAAVIRPWASRGVWFGVIGDFGTDAEVKNGNFKGVWSDWAVLGLVSLAFERGRWELEPHFAAGVMRSGMEGNESMMARNETATLLTSRTGFWVRWRSGLWSLGGSATLDFVPVTRTYTKLSGNGNVFEVPSFAVAIGVFAAADLGR